MAQAVAASCPQVTRCRILQQVIDDFCGRTSQGFFPYGDINAAAVSGIGVETEESVAVCGKPDEMVVLVPESAPDDFRSFFISIPFHDTAF